MSTINIRNLNPVGTDLLSDEETFLNELNDTEQDFVKGGVTITITAVFAVAASVGASYQVVQAGIKVSKAIF